MAHQWGDELVDNEPIQDEDLVNELDNYEEAEGEQLCRGHLLREYLVQHMPT